MVAENLSVLVHLMQQEISKIFRLHLDILIIVENGLRQPLLFLVRTKALSLQNEGSAYGIKKTYITWQT